MLKIWKNLPVSLVSKLFHQTFHHYDLWDPDEFSLLNVNSVFHGQKSISYLGALIWQLVPSKFKDLNTVSAFKAAIRKWNGSQTTAHAGYAKIILEILGYLNYLFGVNNRSWVDCGFYSPGFLIEGFSVSGWQFFF